MEPSGKDFASLADFWPFYLGEHRVKANRTLHFIGSSCGLVFLAVTVWTLQPLWLLAGLVSGYGFAWFGHFVIERNRPATFKHPLKSFLSDWKMFYCILTGKIDGELNRFGL